MSIYDDMQGVSNELLVEFNQKGLSYIQITPDPTSLPYKPKPSIETTYAIKGGVARGVEYKYVDGKQVVASDGQVICKVGDFVPDITGFVVVGGKRHKIKQCSQVPPTGTPVFYLMFYER